MIFDQRNERGVSMVELVVILLFMIALALGGLEISRLLRLASMTAGINREMAASAYRDCWFPATTPIQSGGNRSAAIQSVRNCLQNVINTSNPGVQVVTPGAKITLSVYKWDTFLNPDAVALYGQASTEPNPPPTKVSISDFLTGSAALTTLTNQGVLIYGETYLPYTSQVPIIPRLLGLSSGQLYNIAVF